MLNGGRRGTLLGVLHILGLSRNCIYISAMGYVYVRTVFEKDTCKMVSGSRELMRGIRIITLYKLLGKTDRGSSNLVVNPKIDEILSCVANSTMLWHR